jgi:hypothetical protein
LDILLEWFAKHVQESSRAALEVLVEPFLEEERESVRKRLVDALLVEYRNRGADPPPWLLDD